MLGTKLYKNKPADMARYTECAVWCNTNNASIEDKGDYYEVVESTAYSPSIAEQVAQLDAQYKASKKSLQEYYLEFMIAGDTEGMESIKEELTSLNEQYDASLQALSE